MPFRLKNVGETYQKAMVILFHDMMHKEIRVYKDDMITKSQEIIRKAKKVPAKVESFQVHFRSDLREIIGFRSK